MRCEGVCGESFVPKRRGVVLVGRDLFRRGTFRVCSCRVSATHRCPILTLPPLQRAPHWWRWGFCTTRSLLAACRRRVGPPCSAIPPDWWRRGRGSRRCGRQSADPLGENSQITTVVAEWVCVLGATMSGMVCWSHVNPLLRAVTRDTARKPAIECVGGAAHVRISGFTCTSKGLGHYLSGYRAQRSVSIRQAMGLSCAGVTSVFDRY